jgi:predicted TIM-barrel fold metal-dependent hydrolase
MTERREFLREVGGLGGLAGIPWLRSAEAQGFTSAAQASLADEIAALPVDDVHCHPIAPLASPVTVEDFLELISLSAFPLAKYFPAGVYEQWQRGDPAARRRLSDAHRIDAVRAQVFRHARETVFVKYLVKELARHFQVRPTLEAVIEARNGAAKDSDGYLRALFRDANIANVMLDTGYRQGLDAAGVARFERAIEPTKSWRLSRVDEHEEAALESDDPFEAVEDRFLARVREALDHEGNLGRRSYGMKSYLLPRLGLVKPSYSKAAASRCWDAVRARRRSGAGLPDGDGGDRDLRWAMMADLLAYLHTLAIEECLARDRPIQFHAGDGEAPGGIMRNQDPFLLEELVRLDRDGMMRLPKIVVVHAGYPLVGRGAWLAHLYPNCYFDLSLMTPLIHRGLHHRYLEVLEAVPISKILFGSDAYHAPELYWVAAKWGRRFLALALGDLVAGGQLGRTEAVLAARMILHQNNRELYRI